MLLAGAVLAAGPAAGAPVQDVAGAPGRDTLGAPMRDASAPTIAMFSEICIVHEGDVRGGRAALAARGLHALDPRETRELMVHPGRVYVVPLAGDERLAILSFDNGMCGALAEDVVPGALLSGLAAAMKARGIKVEAVGQAPNGVGQAYRLLGPATRLELMVDIERRDGNRMQASMLVTALDAKGR